MLSALGVVLLYLGSFVEIMDMAMAAIASFAVIITVIEYGKGAPWAVYGVTSILSLILLPQKTPAAFYALFFGFYPIIKEKIERKSKILRWVIKEVVFNICFALMAASEFIVMASELMLIKSKMLLPKAEPEEEDPRAALAEALLKFQQAKAAAALMAKAYPRFSGRMVKDTDEISVDKTFVADQTVTSLCLAVRRIIAYREEHPSADKVTFTPMIAKPIVPVEAKIVGILRHFEVKEQVSLHTLIEDAVSLPDMIAIFLGVLELVKR